MRRRLRNREQVERAVIGVLKWATIGGLTVATGVPLVYMVVLSVRPLQAVLSDPLDVLPGLSELTLAAYRTAVLPPEQGGYDLLNFMGNSLFVAAGTVIVTIVFSTLGAYAASRLEFFGKRTINASFFAVYMFPAIVMAVPLFVLFSRLGLRGELFALIVIYMAETVPVALYMLRNYFESIPEGLEDAAAVDGANRLQIVRRIILPLSAPALAATSLYIFMIAWNEFLFALLFLVERRDNWTVSLGLAQLDDLAVPGTVLMAGSVVLTVPIVVLFFFAERLLVEGLTAGAEKG
jgi:multiple sugar transport system permease protein